MPIMVLTAAYVAINSVDRSALCKKTELAVEVEKKDVTNYASAGWKELKGGLRSGGLDLTFMNDLAAGGFDEVMWGLFGTVVPFEVRASNAAVSTSNPKWTGNILISALKPLSGSPGDVNEASYSYDTSGAVSRATA